MRTLYFILFGFLALQCESDLELIAKEDEKISVENTDIIDKDIPINWPWRGINIVVGPDVQMKVNEQTIRELGASGVNSIRLTIAAREYSIKNNLPIEVGVNELFNYFEQIIQWCANEGIVIIIGSIDFPLDPLKNINRRSLEFWESEVELNAAISYINRLVLKFDKYKNVVAYDFFSEPVVVFKDGTSEKPKAWNDFFHKILKTIRNHSNKYVLYTPGVWGLPKGYNDFKEPIDDNHIIYGFHYYNPHPYTHQGIRNWKESYSYPAFINFKYWNKNAIRNDMEIVANWAKEHNKLVYVGEFSAVRWAEGKDQYLEDVLHVFEENRMGYSYWNFNGWPGWNKDYEEENNGSKKLIKSPNKTGTSQILENFWMLNGQ